MSRNEYFSYSILERLTILLPFSHAENLEFQLLGVEYGLQIWEGENNDVISYFKNLSGFPHEHCEIFQKFGRFPSRNDALV